MSLIVQLADVDLSTSKSLLTAKSLYSLRNRAGGKHLPSGRLVGAAAACIARVSSQFVRALDDTALGLFISLALVGVSNSTSVWILDVSN